MIIIQDGGDRHGETSPVRPLGNAAATEFVIHGIGKIFLTNANVT